MGRVCTLAGVRELDPVIVGAIATGSAERVHRALDDVCFRRDEPSWETSIERLCGALSLLLPRADFQSLPDVHFVLAGSFAPQAEEFPAACAWGIVGLVVEHVRAFPRSAQDELLRVVAAMIFGTLRARCDEVMEMVEGRLPREYGERVRELWRLYD